MLVAAIENAATDTTNKLVASKVRLLEGLLREFAIVVGSENSARDATGGGKAGADADGSSSSAQVEEVRQHVMISYCWNEQPTIKRLHKALVARGFSIWLDIEQMHGSTVCAMAEAIDNACIILFAISSGYKDSANCRLEAMYVTTLSHHTPRTDNVARGH